MKFIQCDVSSSVYASSLDQELGTLTGLESQQEEKLAIKRPL
jgi:hypothetical protein